VLTKTSSTTMVSTEDADQQLTAAMTTGEVVALSDGSYRRRQELINRHHNRNIQVNTAANYMLAVRMKQMSNNFKDIAGALDELKEGVQGQELQVSTLGSSVQSIQEQLQRQYNQMADLELEVRQQASTYDAKLRDSEAVFEKMTGDLKALNDRFKGLVKSNISQDLIVDILLTALSLVIARSPIVQLPLWLISSVLGVLPLSRRIHTVLTRTLTPLLLVVQLLGGHVFLQLLRRKAMEFGAHSGLGGARVYFQIFVNFLKAEREKYQRSKRIAE